jgi:hypothetical protein
MNDRHRETAFLRQCLVYDETGERHRLEERITQLHRNETCVRRAAWLMVFLTTLAITGIAYTLVLIAEYPLDVTQLSGFYFVKAMCVLGVSSLACLLGYFVLGMSYRKELEQRRQDCRRLALAVLESRLGQRAGPVAEPAPPLPANQTDLEPAGEAIPLEKEKNNLTRNVTPQQTPTERKAS